MTTIHTPPTITLTDLDHKRLSAFASAQNGQFAEVSRYLSWELENAKIIKSAKVSPKIVTMNSRVKVRDEVTGNTRIFTLVYPGDEDISIGNLSVLTPVGAALIGLSVGEILEWTTRDGQDKEMTVIEILYQPEADGRFDL